MSCRDWVRPANKKTFRKALVLVRFLGSTPVSSSKFSLLVSLCQQLSYNLEIPIEEIPQDFVPLKNYFNLLLEKAGKKFFVVILLGKFGWPIIFFRKKTYFDVVWSITLTTTAWSVFRDLVFSDLKGQHQPWCTINSDLFL